MKENIERQKVFEEEFSYNETFVDNFEKNTNGWSESEDQNAINKIGNGKFIFENKTSGGYTNLATITIPTNNENFFISMNTTWLKGIDNNSYHILWGANGFSNYFSFGISANGLYRYSTIDNGNYKDIIPLTASEYINKNGSNSIGVRRNGTKIEFYINYFKVNEFEFSEFYGDQIGMSVNGAQRIEFDDLKVGYTIFAVEEFYPDFDPSEIEDSNDSKPKPKTNIQASIVGVKFGNATWSNKNLNIKYFSNGDPITECKNYEEWQSAYTNKQPSWCSYEFDSKNDVKHGILYNTYAIKDERGIAPIGWHIASIEEWRELLKNNTTPAAYGNKCPKPNFLKKLNALCNSGQVLIDFSNDITWNDITMWWTPSKMPYIGGGMTQSNYSIQLWKDYNGKYTFSEQGEPSCSYLRCVKD
jgi:uncharacterized protein (TIGR02145 family)